MAFASISFLSGFLPAVFLLCLLCRRSLRLQNACLLLASLFFYAWGDQWKVLLLLLSALVNRFIALRISGAQARSKSPKGWLVVTVVFNMGMLFGFKYATFGVESLNALLGLGLPVPVIPLPLGISFFTFQALSYVLDVYRRKTPPAPRVLTLLLYLCLFPQLIAGPIEKWQHLEGQFRSRSITPEGVARGLRRTIVGLAKKVLLADSVAVIANLAFSAPQEGLSMPLAWLGALSFTLQIYLDFSGYSDMAVGMGQMFGFQLSENFRMPLRADTMAGFWRRWHITLTDWFREYLYIPLGGSRGGKGRTFCNLMLVFLFTGLWHGANWTFVAWGLVNGLFVAAERFGLLPVGRFPKPLRHLYTLVVVMVGFVLFRADSLGAAAGYLGSMFRPGTLTALQYSHWMEALAPKGLWMLLLALVVSLRGSAAQQWLQSKGWAPALTYSASLLLLGLCYLSLVASGFHPFLYFRF